MSTLALYVKTKFAQSQHASDTLEGNQGVFPHQGLYARVVPANQESRSKKCLSFLTVGRSDNGRRFAKELICSKEWCPIPGQKESDAQSRRIARLLPKAHQMSSMGYFVIEWPVRYRQGRGYAYSKRAWRLASSAIVTVLKGKLSHGEGVGQCYKRGILRWHWYVDPAPDGKATWSPHANVLVDGGYLSPDELALVKGELRKALKCRHLIVNLSYRAMPRQR